MNKPVYIFLPPLKILVTQARAAMPKAIKTWAETFAFSFAGAKCDSCSMISCLIFFINGGVGGMGLQFSGRPSPYIFQK